VAVAIQLVPYGWGHSNPPVRQDAPWPDAESEAIARRSCYACHSNETDWPPYSYVAPMSWLVRWDVERGRDELNFSEWDRDEGRADDAAEQVLDRTMPLDRYTLIHRDARLSDAEVDTLAAALLAMDDGGGGGDGEGGQDGGGGDDGGGDDDDGG
jgi:Haem-binding domain